MIVTNGHEFKTIVNPIHVNGRRVTKVFVNGLQVYPGVERGEKVGRYAMFFGFSHDVISKYSPQPINQYGVYADFAGGTDNVYRVAFAITQDGQYPSRQLFVSYEGFIAGPAITFVPYVAKDGYMVVDGKSSSNINTFSASRNTSGGKVYYSTSAIGANLEDANGNYLAEYTISRTSENVQIFSSANDALNYILS